jgi:DNA helicase II / ATP-dependent DNA helicase PcrA
VVEGYSPKGLIALAEKFGDITVSGWVERVKEYRDAEVEKLTRKGKEEKAEKLGEKVGCLLDLASDLHPDDPVSRLVKHIERMFGKTDGDEGDVLHLCTIHRSKGREWHRVFLVGRNEYQPSHWAVKSGDKEALQQESNLAYVAVTRAKSELVEVDVPPKKQRGSDEPDWWEV